MTSLVRPIIASVFVGVLAIGGYFRGHDDSMRETPMSSAASIVRGKLYRVDPYGVQYPASSLLVRLTHPRYGPSAPSYSGVDGMYYLYNVPPGQFTLEIWWSSLITPTNPMKFNINVHDQPYTDIAPIRVP